MQRTIPKLTTVYLYLTDRCNLNCRHCWINPAYTYQESAKGMDLRLLKDVLEQCFSLGMKSLKLTGGEPVLYDSFMRFLEYLRKKKKKGLFLHMETNGTLIDKKVAQALKKAGMKFASVSIDGDNSYTFNRMRGLDGAFEKAWQAVRYMVEEDIPVQVITAVYRGNAAELVNIARMAQDMGAESIKANIISPVGRGAVMGDRGELLSIEETIELSRKIETEYRKMFKLRFVSSMPVAFRSFNRMLKERMGFCRIKGLLGILATGKISICGIGEEIEELILGDARKDSIKDIWEKNSVLWSIRDGLPSKLSGVCGMCVFKNYCLGCCIAHSYYKSGSLISPFWICQEAYEKGLFPKSRLYGQDRKTASQPR